MRVHAHTQMKVSPRTYDFTGEFYQMSGEELTPVLHKLFQKIEKISNTPLPKPDKCITREGN